MLSESPTLMITCRYWVLSQRFHIKQSRYKLSHVLLNIERNGQSYIFLHKRIILF